MNEEKLTREQEIGIMKRFISIFSLEEFAEFITDVNIAHEIILNANISLRKE